MVNSATKRTSGRQPSSSPSQEETPVCDAHVHAYDVVQTQPTVDRFRRSKPRLRYNGMTRSWTHGFQPRAGSQSPRVLGLHRDMLRQFEQAVESDLIVQVGPYSPETIRSPAGLGRQGAHAYQSHVLPNPLPKRLLRHAKKACNVERDSLQTWEDEDEDDMIEHVSHCPSFAHFSMRKSATSLGLLNDEDSKHEEATDEDDACEWGHSAALQAALETSEKAGGDRARRKMAIHGQMIIDVILVLILVAFYFHLFVFEGHRARSPLSG
jgi:hypothetical protein